MQSRTGRTPSVDDTFLWRICHALDLPPRMLAANIGVAYAELEPLLDARHVLVELDRDEVWWRISEYTDHRLGELMAIKREMSRALQRDRVKRAYRIEHLKSRTKKKPPRG